MTASAPPESLLVLAAIATREAGADGYALFRRDEQGHLTYLEGGGVPISQSDRNLVTFSLRPDEAESCVLAFSFHSQVVTAAAKSRLARMAAAMEQVWSLSTAEASFTGLAIRIGELEAELADSKIVSRARGYLQNPSGSQNDVVDALTRHVQKVLRPFESIALFEKRRLELESELEERSVTARAKALLQERAGLSEGDAHLHLVKVSRRTRRPVREVAIEVIRQRNEQ